jgi:hypothetical protein
MSNEKGLIIDSDILPIVRRWFRRRKKKLYFKSSEILPYFDRMFFFDAVFSIASLLRPYDTQGIVISEVILGFRRFVLIFDVEISRKELFCLFIDTFRGIVSKLLQCNIKDPYDYAEVISEVIFQLHRLAFFLDVESEFDFWKLGEKITLKEVEKLGVDIDLDILIILLDWFRYETEKKFHFKRSKFLHSLRYWFFTAVRSIASEVRPYPYSIQGTVITEVIFRFRRFLLILDVEISRKTLFYLLIDTFRAIAIKLLQCNIKDHWVYRMVILELRRFLYIFKVDNWFDLRRLGEKIVFEEAKKLGVSLPDEFSLTNRC